MFANISNSNDDEAQYQIRALARDLRKTKARINRLHGTCGVSPDAAGCPEQRGGKRRRRRKRTKKKTRRRRRKHRKSRKRRAGASSARRNFNHNRNILGKTSTINEILSQPQQQEEKIPATTEMTAFLIEMLLNREVLVAGYEEPYNRGTVVDVINHQALIVEMQYPSDEGEILVSAFDVTPIP